MPVIMDARYEKNIGNYYGRYLGTFESEQRQVKAYMFAQDQSVVAHVSFAQGLDADTVTDAYLIDLQSFARENGFGGNLRLLFS